MTFSMKMSLIDSALKQPYKYNSTAAELPHTLIRFNAWPRVAFNNVYTAKVRLWAWE